MHILYSALEKSRQFVLRKEDLRTVENRGYHRNKALTNYSGGNYKSCMLDIEGAKRKGVVGSGAREGGNANVVRRGAIKERFRRSCRYSSGLEARTSSGTGGLAG